MKKNRIVAALLAIIGGAVGIHKVYLRQPGQAFMYFMIFFMSINILRMPLSMLLGIYDGLRLLSMSEEEFDRTYNRGVQEWSDRPRSQRSTRRTHQKTRKSKSNDRFAREHRPTRRRTSARKAYAKANPFKQSGIRKFKEYDIEGAIQDFSKALEMAPQDQAVHFNLACSYSLIENAQKAFYHLEQAVVHGFKDKDRIDTHEALAFLRIQDEFDGFKHNGYKMTNRLEAPKKDLLSEDALLSQLNKLAELRNKGLLTSEEFAEQKRRLMK